MTNKDKAKEFLLLINNKDVDSKYKCALVITKLMLLFHMSYEGVLNKIKEISNEEKHSS